MEIGLTDQLLGRTFNGIGAPIDNLGEVAAEKYADVNGKPLNPVSENIPVTISVPVFLRSTV